MKQFHLFLSLLLIFILVHSVLAISYVDLERTTVGTETEGTYPPNIIINDLEISYEANLYNLTNQLISNATADSEGTANMTIPQQYLSSAFEGTFRIYNINATFLYSKWIEDIHGGDIYEIKQSESWTGAVGAFAFFMAIIAITLIVSSRHKKKE